MIEYQVTDSEEQELLFMSAGINGHWADYIHSLRCPEHDAGLGYTIDGSKKQDGSGEFEMDFRVQGCCELFIRNAFRILRDLS